MQIEFRIWQALARDGLGQAPAAAKAIGEALALALVIARASILSHSCPILGEDEKSPGRCLPSEYRAQASGGPCEFDDQPADASEAQTAEALPSSPSRSAPTAGRAPTSPPSSRASGSPKP